MREEDVRVRNGRVIGMRPPNGHENGDTAVGDGVGIDGSTNQRIRSAPWDFHVRSTRTVPMSVKAQTQRSHAPQAMLSLAVFMKKSAETQRLPVPGWPGCPDCMVRLRWPWRSQGPFAKSKGLAVFA